MGDFYGDEDLADSFEKGWKAAKADSAAERVEPGERIEGWARMPDAEVGVFVFDGKHTADPAFGWTRATLVITRTASQEQDGTVEERSARVFGICEALEGLRLRCIGKSSVPSTPQGHVFQEHSAWDGALLDAIHLLREGLVRSLRSSSPETQTEPAAWRNVVGAFLEAYDRAESAVLSVFAIAQLHVGPYKGPQYEVELRALRALLITPDRASSPRASQEPSRGMTEAERDAYRRTRERLFKPVDLSSQEQEGTVERWRKKPVVVDAVQWFKSGDHPEDAREWFHTDESGDFLGEGMVVRYFRHPSISGEKACEHCGLTMHVHGWIDTLEGGNIVCPGDWIIKGVKGEFYPCKPDIFAATYEPASSPVETQGEPVAWISEEGLRALRDGVVAVVIGTEGVGYVTKDDGTRYSFTVPLYRHPARVVPSGMDEEVK